ncbi:TolC family type I secretion outer membrane protein [Caballeronia calidae]|uniref:TolC family type I secretion outer membrane protein n=1 Tax=Caballeronia calidae TaxID=1777139 RepID=A0A158AQ60_9BURK|nr:TolC family protein [Caballeronia calidae]SAK59157.1 TolC family type I secretion outer membrane protein [Caballeronia calidae]
MRKNNVAGWILAGTLACVAPARADDLRSIVDMTLGHDAELAQARADYEAAKQALPIARAALLPQIGGGWGRTYNRIEVESFPRQTYWQSGWMVSVSQALFDWSKWTAYKQSDYVAAKGVVDLAGAQQSAMLRAVKAYFEELAAEDELKRTIEYGAAIQAQSEEIRRKRAAGEATLIDVRDGEVAREQAHLQQLDAQQELSIKRRAVELVSGQPFTSLAALPRDLPLPKLSPESAEVWVDEAKARGYDVQSKQIDWEIAKYDTKKARAAGYPVVNLTGSYTPAGAAAGYAMPTTTTTGMLSVSIPLLTGGEIQGRVRQSLALEDKAEQGVLLASRQAENSARDNYARYIQARERTTTLARLVGSTREALDATKIGYRTGSRTSVDVLRAIDTFYVTQRDLMRARYQAVVTLLNLKADVATLSTEDISQISSMLCCSVKTQSGERTPSANDGATNAPKPAELTFELQPSVPLIENATVR